MDDRQQDWKHGRPSIAVFSGATATIQNTEPLVTSDQARRARGLCSGDSAGFDSLRPQRLAAPVTVYLEAFSAHPLENDAAELYAEPDGFVNEAGEFRPERMSDDDVAVYVAVLSPHDGLYLMPYMAVQADGSPWEGICAKPDSGESGARQTFFPDGSRLFEEIDRFGIDSSGHNNMLSRHADYTFIRAAPSGGYSRGLPAASRTDLGSGDIAPEVRGEDYFPYAPHHLSQSPPAQTLARLTNVVQDAMDSGNFDGAIWLDGSPAVEETAYWLNLLIDTTVPICCNAAQRAHGALSADGDRNIVDSVAYLQSRVWADPDGSDLVGSVLVQDQQVFAARDAQKGDARPGGYVTTGGHGGVVASIGGSGQPNLAYVPNRRHTHSSFVNLRQLPQSVMGVRWTGEIVGTVDVAVKDAAGHILESAIPKVTIAKYSRYGMDDFSDSPDQEVEILARLENNLARFPLSGIVVEGNAPFGHSSESMTSALRQAAFSGVPVVAVGRGNADGFVPVSAREPFVAGSNLTATKARLLLMAALLKCGAAPPAVDVSEPTRDERSAVERYVANLQEIFDSH